MTVTNTLAYYTTELIVFVKLFIVLAPCVNVMNKMQALNKIMFEALNKIMFEALNK
jgi:hypothetical protein